MTYAATVLCFLLALSSLRVLAADPPPASANIKLVLFITIDQLRGDIPLQYSKRFPEGGFNHLIANGVHYSNAHYNHAVTFTAVGHATLATGGGPADHGLIGNDWLDTSTGQHVYCVEDSRHSLIGREARAHEGSSPRNLTSTTFGDEVILATRGRSRVFSVSGKDRGAILPGGQLGKAFWYDKENGQFVTSTYYNQVYPAWVESWNQAQPADRFRGEWTLLNPPQSYLAAGADDRPFERPPAGMNRSFPQPIAGQAFYSNLLTTPMMDQLTCEFAKTLLIQEQLGQNGFTDILAISFSATDYMGHAFGPDSLEAEDNLHRLDRTLADLFTAVDRAVGLAHTLIVLSSDHGVDAPPEAHHNRQLRIAGKTVAQLPVAPESLADCSVGRHVSSSLIKLANASLRKRLNVDADLVSAFWQPSFYLDTARIASLNIDSARVERELADIMSGVAGVGVALTRTDLMAGRVPNTAIAQRLERSFHPKRSGHVLITQALNWYLYSKDTYAAMHGSPHSYDTHVPLFFAGPGIKPGRVTRAIGPQDVAPTISQLLGTAPPSGSTGQVLTEVFSGRD